MDTGRGVTEQNWSIFGKRLKDELVKQGISYRQFADKAGLTLTTVYRYVNSLRIPRATEIIKSAEVLGVTCDYMLGLSDDPHKTRDGLTKAAFHESPSAQPVAKDTNIPINVNDCISRQDAIEHLKKRLYESALNNEGVVSETMEEIADNRIQIWMDELPPSPSRPIVTDTDTISRHDAINVIMDADVCVTWNGVISDDDAVDIAIRATKGSVIGSIAKLPSVQPELKECNVINMEDILVPMSKVQPIDLKCNRCRKQIGKLICPGNISFNTTYISIIKRDGRDPICLEIVCDECFDVDDDQGDQK